MTDSPHFRYLCDVNRVLAARDKDPKDDSDVFKLYEDAKTFLNRVPAQDIVMFTNMSRPGPTIKSKLEEAGIPKEIPLLSAGDVAISYAKRLSEELGYEGRVLGTGFPDFLEYAKSKGLKFVDPMQNGGPETGVLLICFNDSYRLSEGSSIIEGACLHSDKTNEHIRVVFPDHEAAYDQTVEGRKVRRLGTGALVRPILSALDDLGVFYKEHCVGKPSLEWTEELVKSVGWEQEKRIILVDDKNVKFTKPIYKSVQIMREGDGIEWKSKKKGNMVFNDLVEMLDKLPSRLE